MFQSDDLIDIMHGQLVDYKPISLNFAWLCCMNYHLHICTICPGWCVEVLNLLEYNPEAFEYSLHPYCTIAWWFFSRFYILPPQKPCKCITPPPCHSVRITIQFQYVLWVFGRQQSQYDSIINSTAWAWKIQRTVQFCDPWYPTHFYSTWLLHQHHHRLSERYPGN